MPIEFRCSACGNGFHVPDNLAGTKGRCNKCSAIVTIPMPGPTHDASHAQPSALEPLPQQPATGFGTAPSQPAYAAGPTHAQGGGTMPAKPLGSGPVGAQGVPMFVWYIVGGGAGLVMLSIALVVIMSLFGGRSEERTVVQLNGSTSGESVKPTRPVAPTPRPITPTPRPVTPTPRPMRPVATKPVTPANPTTTRPQASSPAANIPIKPSITKPEPTTITPRQTSVAGSAPSKPQAPAAEWGGAQSGELRISVGRDKVTFGPPGCPIVVVGNRVWHLTQKRIVSELQGEYIKYGTSHRALSANGQWFAAQRKMDNDVDRDVFGVWNTVTGKLETVFDVGEEHATEIVLFSLNKYLITGSRESNFLQVWDIASGEAMSSLPTPTDRIDEGKIAFTTDGQYFAAVADKQMVVVKTQTKKVVAVMASPKKMERTSGQALVIRDNKVVADSRRASSTDSVFIFAWLQAMSFSPDSQELAAISTHPRNRLICWNNRGKLVFDEPMDQVARFSNDDSIQWLPDRTGWVVGGSIIDRESRRVVLTVRETFGRDTVLRALDQDRLLGTFPSNPGELVVTQIPWEKIRESVRMMTEGAPAILSPAAPVSANVLLAGLRGSQEETAQMLGSALERRLARDGIRIEQGHETYFQLRLSEEAGDMLPIYEYNSRFDRSGRDTGRRVAEAKGALVVELINGEEVLWRDTIKSTSSRSFSDSINDATVRESMLQRMASSLDRLKIPYFIPESKDDVALPVIIE